MRFRVYASAAVLLLAGCGAGSAPGAGATVSGPPAAGVAASGAPGGDPAGGTGAATPPGAATVPSAGAISTDVAWTQLMIALDERMLAALRLAPQRAGDAALGAFAAEVARQHDTEVAELRKALAKTGAPETNPHEGHDMPGMITQENLALLAAKSGAEFDTMLAASLRAHFEQCRMLAGSEQSAGSDPAVKALAATVESTRTAALSRLAAVTP
ncbi:DUF305 domain-containing protein [Catellatospora bangladeshensis]|uniref:DUF305 domain-containing protein n=2 Tax=Catellatospora bangladeshensis TaxID=310355 RepID=A0A8J3JSQ4_9ACTN|nr:DUF305 domain-containing protein [Catellatospora bangladeshensis]GIF86018.1 hypothetical protein Cba03nite_73670 [Catellatospora bangladeshensis]